MAAREKPRRFRLVAALCFALLAPPWLAAQQKPKSPPSQQSIKLPPQVAATHLIKKVAPVYPAFAKAAGIQGIVRVGVSIDPAGRVHSIGGPVTGWACLWKAAMTAARLYVYRPFMKDRHPVDVETSEDIAFKLPGRHSVFQPPPPPQLTFEDFNGPNNAFENATPVADGPPEVRTWLLSQMQKDTLYSFWTKQGAFKSMKYDLPAKMVEIPTGVPTSRIYLITDNVVSPGLGLGAVLCGTCINCGIWLVEDDAGTIHGLGTSGCYFYVRRRKGSLYPDIFIAFSAPHGLDIYGYINAGGYWGLVYYGAILGTNHEGIHVFRYWRAPTLAARQEPEIPPIQQFLKLPPEVTATHLIKKVAPVYPAFAKAAGIEEVSRVAVVINPDGRVHGSGPATGWVCLGQAAMTAAARYVYRPFMKDGHPIYIETTEDIVFKLLGQHSVFHPPPPPHLTDASFNGFRDATPVADGPPEIRKWLFSQMQNDFAYSLAAKRGAWKDLKYGLPAKMVEIPTWAPPSRFYAMIDNIESPSTGYSLCGNGGCDIWLVQDDAGVVHKVLANGGFGFYVRRRKGSLYPDIFFDSSSGPGETDVDGYANIGGHWGILYCGTLQHGIRLYRQ